eukprot:1180870-Prorocentrum_minimum.AAC.2
MVYHGPVSSGGEQSTPLREYEGPTGDIGWGGGQAIGGQHPRIGFDTANEVLMEPFQFGEKPKVSKEDTTLALSGVTGVGVEFAVFLPLPRHRPPACAAQLSFLQRSHAKEDTSLATRAHILQHIACKQSVNPKTIAKDASNASASRGFGN